MDIASCVYCEQCVDGDVLYCGRCGGKPRGETVAERALSGLMLARRLIEGRVWFGLEKEIAAVKACLGEGGDVYPACEPAIGWLVEEIPRLAFEPDVPRVVEVARLVFGLVPGHAYPEIRAQVTDLARFTKDLREVDRTWRGERPPSRKKASAWLAGLADRSSMTAEQAFESVYETPERWPVVAATVDPEASRRVAWKVEVARADAEFQAKDYKKAWVRLEVVLARDPDCARAHESQARVVKAMGRTGPAITHLRAAVRTGDATATAWNNLAWHLVSGRTPDPTELGEALWAARRAVALAPRSPCWDTLAEVLLRRGDVAEAIAAAREAIRLDPNRPAYRERMSAACAALRPDPAGDFELTALDASEEFEATPLPGPGDSDVTASQPPAFGINLARPGDSGINLQGVGGFDPSQAESIEQAPLDDDEPARPAPRSAARPKQDPNSATDMPGLVPSDPGATPMGMSEKDIFEDTDFSLEVDALESDHDDRTIQIDRSSDFDLEEPDTASDVFPLEEEDVDQDAAFLEEESADVAAYDSGEAESDEELQLGMPGADAPMHAGELVEDEGPAVFDRPRPWTDRIRGALVPLRDAAASIVRPRHVTVTDRVEFSLTAPATLSPGGSYALDVWAYVDALRDEVMARARESQGADDIRIKTKSGVVLARGVVLTVRLAIPSLEVADPEDELDWDGKVGNATFPVSVPDGARPGPHSGTATFDVDNLRIAKLHFVLEVGRGSEAVGPLAAHEARCRFAFASYASEDRDEVLGRLQGIMKVLPDLDLFLDVASLRSGDRWEERLYKEIARRDTLYLFWSLAASRSPWVEREWRTALALRGIAGIDPVPLVSPEDVPPPAELAQQLHFNDWLLAFRSGRRGA